VSTSIVIRWSLSNEIVVEGSADVDESTITGESWPISKAQGNPIVGGTVSIGGTLECVSELSGKTRRCQA